MADFKVGDRVRMVKPYERYGGEVVASFSYLMGHTGTIVLEKTEQYQEVAVAWDKPLPPGGDGFSPPRHMWISISSLEEENPVTEEEVEAAKASIRQTIVESEQKVHQPPPSDLNIRSIENVEWGLLQPDGRVDWFGIKPGGDVGVYTEDEVRYMARGEGRKVMRRTKRVTSTLTKWEEVDDET